MRDLPILDEPPPPTWLAIASCIGAGLSVLSLMAMALWLALQWWG
jgi:hypothetical protein